MRWNLENKLFYRYDDCILFFINDDGKEEQCGRILKEATQASEADTSKLLNELSTLDTHCPMLMSAKFRIWMLSTLYPLFFTSEVLLCSICVCVV